MYSKIINPKTGKKVTVNSRAGINVLREYIRVISSLTGGAAATKASPTRGGVYTFDDDIKIVVMGDIHGDYGALINCLTLGGLIKPAGKLAGRCECTHGHHEDGCEIGLIERWRRGELPDIMVEEFDLGDTQHAHLASLDESARRLSQHSLEKERWTWIGDNSVLVILGDMVDRRRAAATWRPGSGVENDTNRVWESHGFDEFLFEEEIIQRVINNLRDQAEKPGAGGKIIKVIGNHEALNMTLCETHHGSEYITAQPWNNFRYVSLFARKNESLPDDYDPVNGEYVGWNGPRDGERFKKYSPGGLMLNLLKGVADDAPADTPSRNLHGVAKVGNWIFLHAGLMADALTTYLASPSAHRTGTDSPTTWGNCIYFHWFSRCPPNIQ